MSGNSEKYLKQLNMSNKDRSSIRQIVLSLSLLVILIVFWSLKLTGIGKAGEAFCGMEEHVHTEECVNCTKKEHVHIESCYSNINADLETSDDWEKTFADMVKAITVDHHHNLDVKVHSVPALLQFLFYLLFNWNIKLSIPHTIPTFLLFQFANLTIPFCHQKPRIKTNN